MQGRSNATNHLGVNLAFTKFIFVAPRADDEAGRAKVRAAGATMGRGFVNEFEADPARDTIAQETIQFLLQDDGGDVSPGAARYGLQISSRYRPRLHETELELRRRLGEGADVTSIEGAVRVPQYTSAEMHAYAYRHASVRLSGRVHRNVIVLPIRKSREWWEKSALDRHMYFYPHPNPSTGGVIDGHARAAGEGITTIHRRLYYNPDGHGRPGEFDFITYFECADEHLPTFDRVRRALQDLERNPEWTFVEEGPEWRGRRVLRW